MTAVPPRESVGAVVTAGGLGTRFGSLKQFADLDGRPVLARAVEVASRFACAIAVPLPQGHEASARAALDSGGDAGATGGDAGATGGDAGATGGDFEATWWSAHCAAVTASLSDSSPNRSGP